MKKRISLLLFTVLLAVTMVACGSGSNEKVYLEESEIDSALSNPNEYKGKYIELTGRVFNVNKEGDSVAIQAWHDVENYDQDFLVYISKDEIDSVKEDDFIKVNGRIEGTYKGENMFGNKLETIQIAAESVEIGSYDELINPASETKEIQETQTQHKVSVTVDSVAFASDETRVYITVKNDSGHNASLYTFNAKAIQGGKQFEHKDNWEMGDEDIGEVLPGASKSGVLRFQGLDQAAPFTINIEAYSDNYDVEMKDYVFELNK